MWSYFFSNYLINHRYLKLRRIGITVNAKFSVAQPHSFCDCNSYVVVPLYINRESGSEVNLLDQKHN